MADDDDILVQVEGEEQTEHEGEVDPVAELKRQFEAQKAENQKLEAARVASDRRAAEERARADAATREVNEARTIVADRELDTIVSGIAAAQAEVDAAEQAWAIAAEAGDFKKQAEANKKLALATSRQTQLETAKADLELRRSTSDQSRTGDGQRREPRGGDPFEDHVSKFTPRTADWMRAHRDWVVDPAKSAELGGAHHRAVREGIKPDTDEYFEFVEKMIGLRQEDVPIRNGAGNVQQRTAARRSTPVVAPVNGGAGAHTSGGENRTPTVTLSPGEARMAKEILVWNKGERDAKGNVLKEGDPRIGQPIGTTEYARRKLKMQASGYYRGDYSGS